MTQRKFSEIKQTVYDYNKWKGPAVIYFNIVDGQFWTNATNLLDPIWPRKPTAEDVVIVSKDYHSREIKISIEEVKSMAENVLKEIENNEKRKIEIEEEIEKVRHGCNDCCLRDNCIIAYAVDSIVERSEKDYDVMNTLLSLCRGKLLCSYWYPEDEDE